MIVTEVVSLSMLVTVAVVIDVLGSEVVVDVVVVSLVVVYVEVRVVSVDTGDVVTVTVGVVVVSAVNTSISTDAMVYSVASATDVEESSVVVVVV
jgi:hypothetical protein